MLLLYTTLGNNQFWLSHTVGRACQASANLSVSSERSKLPAARIKSYHPYVREIKICWYVTLLVKGFSAMRSQSCESDGLKFYGWFCGATAK